MLPRPVGTGEQAARDAHATIAATAADALRKNTGRRIAVRQDARLIVECDGAAHSARGTRATHREGQRANLAAGRDRQREATVAAGVGDALGADAIGLEAAGMDRVPVVANGHVAGVAAGATRTADAEGGTGLSRRRRNADAAVAATAADALRKDAARVVTFGVDVRASSAGDCYGRAVAAGSAAAAHTDAHGSQVRNGRSDCEAARAATAADALGIDARRIDPVGEDVGGTAYAYGTARCRRPSMIHRWRWPRRADWHPLPRKPRSLSRHRRHRCSAR